MKTGLFFGSFNPVHNGHLAIANYMTEFTDISQLWFVVSPHNPLKNKETLLDNRQRYELVYRAIGDYIKFRVTDIEFSMPQPSYTIDTLMYLEEKYPNHRFCLIMGADNLMSFDKWKNPDEILNRYEIYIYPRKGTDEKKIIKHKNIKKLNAPLIEISSSFIRNSIKEGKDIRFFLHPDVNDYITEMNFYRK